MNGSLQSQQGNPTSLQTAGNMQAAERGAAKAVFIGPDDVERGSARLKDLESRAEEELCLS